MVLLWCLFLNARRILDGEQNQQIDYLFGAEKTSWSSGAVHVCILSSWEYNTCHQTVPHKHVSIPVTCPWCNSTGWGKFTVFFFLKKKIVLFISETSWISFENILLWLVSTKKQIGTENVKTISLKTIQVKSCIDISVKSGRQKLSLPSGALGFHSFQNNNVHISKLKQNAQKEIRQKNKRKSLKHLSFGLSSTLTWVFTSLNCHARLNTEDTIHFTWKTKYAHHEKSLLAYNQLSTDPFFTPKFYCQITFGPFLIFYKLGVDSNKILSPSCSQQTASEFI